MPLDTRTAVIARRAGSAALVVATVAAAAGLARGLPDPQLMANLDNSCLQFSEDGGAVWGDVSVIQLDDSFVPAPGGEYLQGDFLARNTCATPAVFQVYAGRWDVAAGASGSWRTDLAGATGSPVTLTGPAAPEDWGVLIGQTAAPVNQAIPVRLYLGIPAAETMQNYSLTPGWAFALEATAPTDAPAAPSLTQVSPAAPTTADPVTVSGTAEPGSTVEVKVDGVVRCTTTATPAGTFSCDLGTLPKGDHVITATATNAAGTSSPSAGVGVTVRGTGSGWGSLGDLLGALFGTGSLGGLLGVLFGSGSLGSLGSSAGSLGSLDGLGSTGGQTGWGSLGSTGGSQQGTGSTGSAGSTAGSQSGSTTGGSPPGGTGPGSTANSTGAHAGSGTGAQQGGQSTGGPAAGGSETGASATGGSGAGEDGATTPGSGTGGSAGSQGSAGSEVGTIPHATLGLGSAQPGGTGAVDGAGVTGFADAADAAATDPVTGSLGRTAGARSVDGLLHLGGPTIRAVQR